MLSCVAGFAGYALPMAVRFSTTLCPRMQAAVDLLGRRWTALIVQQLQEKPRRYSELREALDVMSERMLIQRLKELESAGVLLRNVIDDQPVRVEYQLTEKGRALGRVIGGLQRWAEEWIPELTR
jgi:DNA-binding HxlR family transcriptional regulator